MRADPDQLHNVANSSDYLPARRSLHAALEAERRNSSDARALGHADVFEKSPYGMFVKYPWKQPKNVTFAWTRQRVAAVAQHQ